MPDSVAAGLRLAPEELTRPFAPEQFAFDTTDDLEPFRGVLGQERAVEALQFGVAMPRPGYNVFVMGEPGTGRFSFVKRYLQAEGKRVATPSDWVYLNNFDEPREPRVIELPPGSATEFSADIDRLIDNLMSTFPAVFEHPAYQQKKNAVDRAFNQRYDRALDSVERRALEKDVALYRDSANVAFTPMKDGKALDEAEFAQLPEAERERFHKDIAALGSTSTRNWRACRSGSASRATSCASSTRKPSPWPCSPCWRLWWRSTTTTRASAPTCRRCN